MIKKLLIAVLGLGVCLGGIALFVTRDTGPTHPTLVAAKLPPLIPTRAFYADPNSKWDFVATGDAELVAYRKSSLTGRSLVVAEVTSGEEFAEFPIGAQHVRWHPTKPLLRFIFEGHDWEVDPYKPDRADWKRISPVKLSGGWVKNEVAADAEMPILTWGKGSMRSTGHMWLVSQDGLAAEKISEGTEDTVFWVFDQDMNPVLRKDSLDPKTERFLRKTADGWETLMDVSLNETFLPISKVDPDGTLLARSSIGRDKIALVRFDTRTGEETVLQASQDSDIALTSALTHTDGPDVLRLSPHSQERIALTGRGEVFLNVLGQFPQPVTFGATHLTSSGRYVTQSLSAQSTAWQNILIDLEEGTYVPLAKGALHVFDEHLAQERAVRFTARDGLEIPAILTMPKEIDGPLPFIVHVHGGPAQHMSLGYRNGMQFLVNRGYGVLSVNFRGSTGFGKAFQSKGFRQFGRAMQNDISDAALWLIDERLADTDALAVMGESYGGYAAALAMTQEPGLFDAAIVEFPMLDIEFQSKHYPGFWSNGLGGWWRYFGRIGRSADIELMRQYSPSNLVNKLHGPMMVLAGERDQITAVQQVKDYQEKVEAAGKDVAFHYFPNAGHGVSHWRDRLRRARLLEDFLAEQLGGRSGGFEFAERAPAFID